MLAFRLGSNFGRWQRFPVGFDGRDHTAHRSFNGASFALKRPNVPDVARVLQNGAVAGKLADAGNIQDCLAPPGFLIQILPIDQLLRLHVGREVGDMEIAVAAMDQFVEDPAEQAVLVRAEAVGGQSVHHLAHRRIAIVTLARVIRSLHLHLVNLFCPQPEDVDVVFAHLFGNLDIGAVVGADGQRAVHRQLHVARA